MLIDQHRAVPKKLHARFAAGVSSSKEANHAAQTAIQSSPGDKCGVSNGGSEDALCATVEYRNAAGGPTDRATFVNQSGISAIRPNQKAHFASPGAICSGSLIGKRCITRRRTGTKEDAAAASR